MNASFQSAVTRCESLSMEKEDTFLESLTPLISADSVSLQSPFSFTYFILVLFLFGISLK